MTLAEYKKLMKQNKDWAPGWDAILQCLNNLYKQQQPTSFQTELPVRMGGTDYLDGFCVYKSKKQIPHKHVISYGMSALLPHEVYFNRDYSGWGYEMTMRIKDDGKDTCLWAMDMISNLAAYTNLNEKAWLEAEQFIQGSGDSINLDVQSEITSLITVYDPELPAIDTIHGRLEFLQLVGITTAEFAAIVEYPPNLERLIKNMKKDNPLFITDLGRTKSYI